MRILKKILRIIAILLPCFVFGLIFTPKTYALQYTNDSLYLWPRYLGDYQADSSISSGLLNGRPNNGFTFSLYQNYPVKGNIPQGYKNDVRYDGSNCVFSGSPLRSPYNFYSDSSSVSPDSDGRVYISFDRTLYNDNDPSHCFNIQPRTIINLPSGAIWPFPSRFYSYNALRLFNSNVQSSTGVLYERSFRFRDFIYSADDQCVPEVGGDGANTSPSCNPEQTYYRFGNVTIPFYINENLSSFGSYSQYREFDFKILMSASEFEWSDFAKNYVSPFIYGYGIYYKNNGYDDEYISNKCSVNRTVVQHAGSDSSVNQIEFSCHLILPRDYANMSFFFQFDWSPSAPSNPDKYLFRTSTDLQISPLIIITDNDTTPGGDIGPDSDGSVIGGDIAPNGDKPNSSNGSPDFFGSLVNLFQFNLANPFSGLYDLFRGGSDCVAIPNLSNMLHSEETVYCPWFPSSVRNVLTPVFGISSIMLLFGFFVRWLGGSSNTLFDDGSNIAPPGTRVENDVLAHRGWRRRSK